MNSVTKQLLKDLKQLEQEPIIGANAAPMDNDLMTWYAIVVGSEGTPYANIPIRFILEFPNDYPISPPKGFFDTYIRYTGGASYMVNNRISIMLEYFW